MCACVTAGVPAVRIQMQCTCMHACTDVDLYTCALIHIFVALVQLRQATLPVSLLIKPERLRRTILRNLPSQPLALEGQPDVDDDRLA